MAVFPVFFPARTFASPQTEAIRKPVSITAITLPGPAKAPMAAISFISPAPKASIL